MSYGNYPDLTSVQRVLIIKLRHLGDVLLSTPIFSSLKEALPHAQLDGYIYQDSLPMLEGNPYISSLLTYDRKWKELPLLSRIRKELKGLQAIRSRHYDLVLNLTEGDRGALAAKFSRAPIRVGFDPKGKGLFGKKHLYTHVVKVNGSPRHNVERNLDALRKIGIQPKEKDLSFFIPVESQNAMKSLLDQSGFSPQKFILIHPVSRWKFKCWPMEKVQELIRLLLQKGEKVVLSGGKDKEELQLVAELERACPSPNVLNLAGKISLKELGALIQLSKLLVSVDSVPVHMASALKAPCIAIFGPSSDLIWGPWRNPQGKVISLPFSCRPCGLDGCGGSKISDCLHSLSAAALFEMITSFSS